MTNGQESLYEKLKSMGVRLGAESLKPPAPVSPRALPFPIEQVVAGEDVITAAGDAFVAQLHYPAAYTHGRFGLCAPCALDGLAAWSTAQRLRDPALRNVVYLDTETTGLAGGTGTHAFLVGIGYNTPDGFHLAQFFMRDPAQEGALLIALQEWLQQFEVVVTFNGKTFDLPLLNTRYTLNRLPTPFNGSTFEHIDLLHLARKLWRDRLASRRLGELERQIIGFQRSGEDIPGFLVPQIYFDYLRSGDARPLQGVFYHNAIDILSLAALLHHTSALLDAPEQYAPANDSSGLDLAAIARLYEDMGKLERAALLYERSLDQGLPEIFFYKTIERYATMLRKQGAPQDAARLWQRAAERGWLVACVELAKYHEHTRRDYPEALRWTEAAIRLVPQTYEFSFAQKDALRDLSQRADRLRKKLNRERHNSSAAMGGEPQ